jgi:hypothetical protein
MTEIRIALSTERNGVKVIGMAVTPLAADRMAMG